MSETVTVRIHLLDTVSGLDAWHEYQMDAARADDVDDSEGFWWTDGNAACDCERGRCLYKARGESDPGLPCGSSRILIVEATVNGKQKPSWCDELKPVNRPS